MNTANLKKKLNIEKHETILRLDLPEGRELKEEVIENSKNISTQQQWYRRRVDKLSAAARRSTKVGGGANKLSAAAARRGRRTALPLRPELCVDITLLAVGRRSIFIPSGGQTWSLLFINVAYLFQTF